MRQTAARSKELTQRRSGAPARAFVTFLCAVVILTPLAGCRRFFWPATTISAEHRAYYHRKVAQVDAEAAHTDLMPAPEIFGAPPEVRDRLPEERLGEDLWPLTLFSAVRLALENNAVIRQDAQFLSTSNPIFNSIDANASVFDPYIQDTNITFGNRGVAGAMSDFATQLSTSMTWAHDDSVNNVGALTDITDSTRQFDFRLEKELAFGGTLGLSHSVDFLNTTNPNNTLNSTYSGPLSVDFTMPLLAGAGTEFTQIAGPLAFLATRITSLNQGVLISQINSELARLDLEESIRGLVRDVVTLYWDLSLAYVRIETEQKATDDAQEVFDRATAEFDAGRTRAADEAQAAETYYAAQSRLEEALRTYDETERRLRRLIGLPISDGRMIQPIDEPALEPVPSFWNPMLADALSRRPQIRRQKHNLRSNQLQLKAARSLNRPRLDFISQYAVNGFGDRLTSDSGATTNYYQRIADGTLTGWTTGFQFSMPLGFPQQRAQVNNLELRVAKGMTQLAIAESEVAHELALRLQSAQRWQRIASTNEKRRDAATRLVKSLEADYEFQRGDIDQLVRAQATLAAADVEYYRSRVEFRKALAELRFAQASLLESNQVALSFPKLPVAGFRHEPVRHPWTAVLPGGHLPKPLPSAPTTVDPGIVPAGELGPPVTPVVSREVNVVPANHVEASTDVVLPTGAEIEAIPAAKIPGLFVPSESVTTVDAAVDGMPPLAPPPLPALPTPQVGNESRPDSGPTPAANDQPDDSSWIPVRASLLEGPQ